MSSRIFILLMGLALSGRAQDYTIEKFHWLTGTWQRVNKNTFEVWRQTDQMLLGKSFKVQNADTVMLETISLTEKNGVYYYTADVAGPQLPVAFKITMVHESGFVAENPAHDFPKVIRYKIYAEKNEVFLEASIEGNGKSMIYLFTKIK